MVVFDRHARAPPEASTKDACIDAHVQREFSVVLASRRRFSVTRRTTPRSFGPRLHLFKLLGTAIIAIIAKTWWFGLS